MAWSNRRNEGLRVRAERVIPGRKYGQEATALLPKAYPQFCKRAQRARLWDSSPAERQLQGWRASSSFG